VLRSAALVVGPLQILLSLSVFLSPITFMFPLFAFRSLCSLFRVSGDTTPFWALPEPHLKRFLYKHRLVFANSLTSGLRKPFPFPFRVRVSFLREFPTFPSPVPTFRINPSSFRVAPVRADSTFLIRTRVSHAYYAGGLTCDPSRFRAPVALRITHSTCSSRAQ
jgi:hypothetical protein